MADDKFTENSQPDHSDAEQFTADEIRAEGGAGDHPDAGSRDTGHARAADDAVAPLSTPRPADDGAGFAQATYPDPDRSDPVYPTSGFPSSGFTRPDLASPDVAVPGYTTGRPEPTGYYGAPSGYGAPGGYAAAGAYPGSGGAVPAPFGSAGFPPPPSPISTAGIGEQRPSLRRRLTPLAPVAIIAAIIGGLVGGGVVAIADNNRSTNTGLKITNDTSAPAAKVDGTIGAAADTIRPSVVTINEVSGQSGGTGSGVILRSDGYILTNDHVISLAASGGSLQVTLSDGRTAPATIVGRDTSDDLAVIRATGLTGLTPATFGKSGTLSVGQTVVAVGAPLGLSDTVTSGIVSNTARPVRAGDNNQAVFQAIQTDAAINPGNSGGPLVDLNGSVIGINAAIATDNSGGGLQIPGQTQQSGNIGIGFAIPSDEASRIASELIANGKAYHAVVGISVKDASSSTTSGVVVAAVNSGSGAAKAGVKVNDLITKIDGTTVTSSDALIAAIRSHAPGAQVQLTLTRGGSTQTVTVTLDSSDK